MAKAGLKKKNRLSGGKTVPHLQCGGDVCGFFVRALRVATKQSGNSRPTSLLKRCLIAFFYTVVLKKVQTCFDYPIGIVQNPFMQKLSLTTCSRKGQNTNRRCIEALLL